MWIPLVIHGDSCGLVLLRKTCRLCVACEMLIAHEFELNAEVQRVAARSDLDAEYWCLEHSDPEHGGQECANASRSSRSNTIWRISSRT